jgi:hypothetical protein
MEKNIPPPLKSWGGIFGPDDSGNRFLFAVSGYLFQTGDHFLKKETKMRPKLHLQKRKKMRQTGETGKKTRQTTKNTIFSREAKARKNTWRNQEVNWF